MAMWFRLKSMFSRMNGRMILHFGLTLRLSAPDQPPATLPDHDQYL